MKNFNTLSGTLVLTALLLLALSSKAQRNVIKFDPENCEQFTRGFREIIVLDQRPDTLGAIGYVKLGPGRRPVNVETEGPLSGAIGDYYRAVAAKAMTGDSDLVVVIYDMMATEEAGFSKDFGLFRFRAEYFTGQQDAYRSLGMIDTMVEISALNVTAKLMRKIDECLCGFCWQLLDKQPSGGTYTLAEVRQIEQVRRMEIPAYKTKPYPDGIYASWEDFQQLKTIEGKKLLGYKKNMFTAQGTSKKGKPYIFHVVASDPDRAINPGRIIVFQGVPYKAFEGKFYPMSFAGDSNFHFVARTASYNPGGSGVFVPMVMPGGGLSVFAISNPAKMEEYDFTINWRSGKVIPGRQIISPKDKKRNK